MKRRTESVWAKNNSEQWFASRYDGEDFEIPPGESIEMEVDCAKLVFGFGEPDKVRAIRRLGWAPTSAEMPAALSRLNTFSFHMEPPAEDADGTTASSAPGGDTEPSGASSGAPGGTDQTEGDLPNRPPARGKARPSLDKLARVNAAG